MREADRQSESEKGGRRGAKEARGERIGKEMSKRQERKEGKEKRKSCALVGTRVTLLIMERHLATSDDITAILFNLN